MNHFISREMKRYNHLLGELDAVYHGIALKLGLTDSALIILYTICNKGDTCPLSEICRYSGLSKQTVNSAIRKLEGEGILYLERADARSKNVCLTEAGKSLAERTALRLLNMEDRILASWPAQDVEKYLELTERFLVGIQESASLL